MLRVFYAGSLLPWPWSPIQAIPTTPTPCHRHVPWQVYVRTCDENRTVFLCALCHKLTSQNAVNHLTSCGQKYKRYAFPPSSLGRVIHSPSLKYSKSGDVLARASEASWPVTLCQILPHLGLKDGWGKWHTKHWRPQLLLPTHDMGMVCRMSGCTFWWPTPGSRGSKVQALAILTCTRRSLSSKCDWASHLLRCVHSLSSVVRVVLTHYMHTHTLLLTYYMHTHTLLLTYYMHAHTLLLTYYMHTHTHVPCHVTAKWWGRANVLCVRAFGCMCLCSLMLHDTLYGWSKTLIGLEGTLIKRGVTRKKERKKERKKVLLTLEQMPFYY